jgi:pyruvyltransferase
MFNRIKKKLGGLLMKGLFLLKYFLLKTKFKINNDKYLISHFANVRNFGDNFNFDLMSFFGYKLIWTPYYKKSQLALTGSILGSYLREYNGLVLGSGFIRSSYNRKNNNWDVKLIRGPLSAEQCGAKKVFYGDPGILASRVYSSLRKITKKYELGILPHSQDYDKIKDLDLENVIIINPRLKSRVVAEKISKCKNIASSSLHGLIFSDSFEIPNIHILLSNRVTGGDHKFKDYYKAFDLNHKFIDLRNRNITDSVMKKILENCTINIEKSKLDKIQDEIERIFKNSLNDIYKSKP